MSEILLKRPYASIQWEDDFNGMSIHLQGYIPSADFREVLEKALDFLKARKVHRWIVDLSEHKVTSLDDQEWLGKNWIPRCIAAGLNQTATVLPKNVIAQMGFKRVSTLIDHPAEEAPVSDKVTAVYFDSVEEARQWMLNLK